MERLDNGVPLSAVPEWKLRLFHKQFKFNSILIKKSTFLEIVRNAFGEMKEESRARIDREREENKEKQKYKRFFCFVLEFSPRSQVLTVSHSILVKIHNSLSMI